MGAAVWDPAMTDFRARGTIMGLAGLTAVFGMGTGGAPPVSSPESGRGAVRPRGRGGRSGESGHGRGEGCGVAVRPSGGRGHSDRSINCVRGDQSPPARRRTVADATIRVGWCDADRGEAIGVGRGTAGVRIPTPPARAAPRVGPSTAGRGGQAVRLLGPVGCVGRPTVHSRPIDLVVFQEPSGYLSMETWSWRGLRA